MVAGWFMRVFGEGRLSASKRGTEKVGLVWCLVFCGGNGGGEMLCNVERGMLVEISKGLKVCLFLHCSRRIWELGDKGMSNQDCHSW